MKKYFQPAAKISGILSVVFSAMILSGVLLIIFAPEQTNLILFFLGFGIPLSLISLAVFIPAVRSYVIIDDNRIVFPTTKEPKLSLKRNPVLFKDIKRISVTCHEASKPNILLVILFAILLQDALSGTKSTYTYTFHLKNGDKFTETFYNYGKKQEQEIISILKERVCFSSDMNYS